MQHTRLSFSCPQLTLLALILPLSETVLADLRGRSSMRPWTMVVDPFSAASKPMPDWESMPSRPLPFAATLEALDLNESQSATQHLPKPRRREKDGIPAAFPTPVYSHDRSPRPSASGTSRRLSYGSGEQEIGSDEWIQRRVGECVDNARCELDIS